MITSIITTYINGKGESVDTKEKDLTNIITKEVTKIGFYQNEKKEMQAVKIPITIEKVPKKLPKEITSLQGMFSGTLVFNQDLLSWNTSNITNMKSMFSNTKAFNGNISSWNTTNVTTTHNMFGGASAFNQDISFWKTGNVTDMSYMFYEAKKFNQNISRWSVNKVKEHYDFSVDSGIDNSNKLPKKCIILGTD